MTTNAGPGRIQLHDPRSRGYQYPHTTPATGKSVRHRLGAPNLDQFYTNGCVGFTGGNALNCQIAVRSRMVFNRPNRERTARGYLDNNDGLHNYSAATKNDPFDWIYPPTDQGSSAIGLMKYWKRIGVISAYEWTFTFDAFLAALQQQPVLVGTDWYPETMNHPQPNGLVTVGGKKQGGHEYLATGMLWDRKWVSFEQPWGENFGIGGRFYMHFNDAEALLMDGGDSCVPKFL